MSPPRWLKHAATTLLCVCSGCGNSSSGVKQKENSAPLKTSLVQNSFGAHGGQLKQLADARIELTFDSKSGAVELYAYAEDGVTPRAIEPPHLTAERLSNGATEFEEIVLQAAKDAGTDSRATHFSGSAPKFSDVGGFGVVASIFTDAKRYRARFFLGGKAAAAFVCPMGCEKAGVYSVAGRCPACGMALVNRSEAHTDHTPKHGGIFFMAPDGWHHLEGVLVSPQEFRLYFYNNFTRPISAQPFAAGGTLDIQTLSADGKKSNAVSGATFESGDDGAFLRARIAQGVDLPLAISAHIKFRENDPAALFDFSFSKPSKTQP